MIHSLEHHAYALAGRSEEIIPRLVSALEKTGYSIKGNPDFRQEAHDVFGIDEARALKEAAQRTAVSGGKKVFIVSIRGITKEAQNALLKIFEEPPQDTHFFLIVPSFEILLPTLRSRLSMMTEAPEASASSSLASGFLSDSVPKRLKTIQGLLKGAEEESGKQALVDFFDALERTLAAQERNTGAQALAEVLQVKRYVRDRAPSFKLLLEHLALVLPRVE